MHTHALEYLFINAEHKWGICKEVGSNNTSGAHHLGVPMSQGTLGLDLRLNVYHHYETRRENASSPTLKQEESDRGLAIFIGGLNSKDTVNNYRRAHIQGSLNHQETSTTWIDGVWNAYA